MSTDSAYVSTHTLPEGSCVGEGAPRIPHTRVLSFVLAPKTIHPWCAPNRAPQPLSAGRLQGLRSTIAQFLEQSMSPIVELDHSDGTQLDECQ